MNGELVQIDSRIKDLKEKKVEIIEKLKQEKRVTKQNRNQHNDSPNVLKRISTKFDSRINEINDKREEAGLDGLSKPKITELIVRHKSFPIIEKDIIDFNPNLEEEGKE